MTPTDIIAILGAITGVLSLIIIFYKHITDKPKLSFELERSFFMQPMENDNFTSIFIELKVHNKGTKSTTIHDSELEFKYKNEHKTIKSNTGTTIDPSTTTKFYPQINIRKNELRIYHEIESCTLKLFHTHGTNKIKIGTITELEK